MLIGFIFILIFFCWFFFFVLGGCVFLGGFGFFCFFLTVLKGFEMFKKVI